MSTTTETLVADLKDRGEPLAESPHDCYLEVDRDDHKAIVVWREPPAFHAEFNGRRVRNRAGRHGMVVSRWDRHNVHVRWTDPPHPFAYGNEAEDDNWVPRSGLASLSDDHWTQYVDDTGTLTDEARRQIATKLAEYLSRASVDANVYVEDYGGDDEPTLTFEVFTTYEAGETFDSWFERIGWPVVATLINVTDPGTFNSPYLFDMSALP